MSSPRFSPGKPGLHAELYQLVQAAVYHGDGLWGEAVFDLSLRELPPDHGYAIAAGIEPAIDAVLDMRFGEEELAWLRALPMFAAVSTHFFESLANFRFTGDIRAVSEGTPIFPGEPLLTITAPLTQIGLIETRLLQRIGHATAVATKASRLCQAARGRGVVDFAARRCAGAQAAWDLARAASIGGCVATTYGAAAAGLGISPWAVASETLSAAYGADARALQALRLHFPGHCHVNLPSPDVRQAARMLRAMAEDIRTVRLADTDLAGTSRALRAALDAAGLHRTRILGTGSLDEHDIAAMVEAEAPIALFGVGTALATASASSGPRLAYRMAEMQRGLELTPARGPGASQWPGRKQVVRLPDRDLLCLEAEHAASAWPEAEELLSPVVIGGQRVREEPSLDDLRRHCDVQLDLISTEARRLRDPEPWPVVPSAALRELAQH